MNDTFNIPIKQLIHNEGVSLYTLGDTADVYVGYEYKSDNVHFIAYYKESNDYWVAYSIKYNKKVLAYHGINYLVLANDKTESKARGIKILYQDKIVRFLSIAKSSGKKDFIFVIKNMKNIDTGEENEE